MSVHIQLYDNIYILKKKHVHIKKNIYIIMHVSTHTYKHIHIMLTYMITHARTSYGIEHPTCDVYILHMHHICNKYFIYTHSRRSPGRYVILPCMCVRVSVCEWVCLCVCVYSIRGMRASARACHIALVLFVYQVSVTSILGLFCAYTRSLLRLY